MVPIFRVVRKFAKILIAQHSIDESKGLCSSDPGNRQKLQKFRDQKKGGLAKGVSAESSVVVKQTKNQYMWHSERHSQKRRTFLQTTPPLQKEPFSWFLKNGGCLPGIMTLCQKHSFFDNPSCISFLLSTPETELRGVGTLLLQIQIT